MILVQANRNRLLGEVLLAPTVPLNFDITQSNNEDGINVDVSSTWGVPVGGGTPDYYRVSYRLTSAGGAYTALPDTTDLFDAVTLAPDTYDFIVQAGNSAGLSDAAQISGVVIAISFDVLDLNPLVWTAARLGVTSSGGSVSAEIDHSGNGNDLPQATPANQPTLTASNPDFNGVPTTDFNGIDQYLYNSVLSSTLTDCTFFLVFKVNAIGVNGDTLITSETTNDKRFFYGTSSGLTDGALRNGTKTYNILSVPVGSCHILMFQMSGSDLKVRLNDDVYTLFQLFDSSTTSALGLGRSQGLLSRYANFDKGDLIVIPNVISESDMDQVFNYLNNIYNVY